MEFYFDKSLFGWAIKDARSRYVYANDLACRYFRVKKSALTGCTDADLIPALNHACKYILQDDRKILSTHKMSIALKIFDYGGKGKISAYRVEKRPWTLPDSSPAIICTYIELTNVYLSTFLNQHDRRPLVFTQPSTLFTDREWEVILLLLCGVKRKVMATTLGISGLTLRNRISRCCEKAGVVNQSVLTEHCFANGWDNYVPPFFLKQGYVSLC
ncbi:PAS domain-containing protein [Pantoea sp. FN060301]|uniref:PAS domain-containing protein n=1 Tax=Pantoea sp. FN060301 TaxID=3420380 RepID=UPI003D174AB7